MFRRLNPSTQKMQRDSLGLKMVRNVQPVVAKDIDIDINEFTLEESQVADTKAEMVRLDKDIDMDIGQQ